MSQPRVLIVRTGGTNCDQETLHAFELAGAEVSLVHTNKLLSASQMLGEHHIFVIPGGFTYGDDIAAGRVLANELRAFLQEDLARHVGRGGLVLGICNGFQVLVKTGLLPGFDIGGATQAKTENDMVQVGLQNGGAHCHSDPERSEGEESPTSRVEPLFKEVLRFAQNDSKALPGFEPCPESGRTERLRLSQIVALTFNDSNKFEDRWVYLKVCSKKSEFINSSVGTVYLPVAHGEGKFVPLDEKVLSRLEAQNQVVLRYSLPPGMATLENRIPYPYNPNGSVGDIAGICDPTGRILGLMPHPERHVHPTSHPRWTREGLKETPDGLTFFLRAVDYVRKNLL